MQKPHVEIASDVQDLARRMVQLFISTAGEAIAARGMFHTALSGGRTPERFFTQLASTPEARALPWGKIQVFWVDERYVPPDSQASNYRLADEAFLSRIDIPAANVHRIPTENSDIAEAARAYEKTLRAAFHLREGGVPAFDLIVLGMGSDGHTASLFPDSYPAYDADDPVGVVYLADETKFNRITLTRRVLLAAHRLVVLVSGSEKAHTLKEVFAGEPDEARYPVHVLWPVLDRITWLIDHDAAREIPGIEEK